MRLIQRILFVSILLFSIMFFGSCDTINPLNEGDLVDYSCEGCHTNKGTLSSVIDDLVLDPPEEGHEAPG